MALSFNSATKKWERSTTAPVVSSIPKAPAPVQTVNTPTPTVTPPVTATSTNNVASSFPWFPNRKVATTTNPVITRSAPAPTSITPPANEITSRDDNQIKDYVAWAELNPWTLSVEDQFKLRRGQQVLQERAYQQSTIDPYKQQITQEETLRKQRESELKQRDTQLADARRRELELTYGKRISWQQEAGDKTMSAAQGVLSFSWFGRSTYAAEKQAEIQQQVNENINALNAERDYAIAKYEAELSWATAEELSGYDQSIADLRNKSAQFSVQLAQQMNEYNMQTSASYEERINNVLKLAQSLETVELTPWQQSEAWAYASLLLDSEWNINDKMLADIPPQIKGLALRKAAELKSGMTPKKEAPETIKAEDGSVYAFNDQTGQFEKIIWGKPMQSDKTVNIKNADWSESIMQYNTQTGQYDIPVQPSGFTPNGTPVNTAIQTAIQKCETWAQCWKFVNDVLQGAWLPRLVKDSYQSKEMAISQIGIATTSEDLWSGSIFAYPVKWSNYWHIGIVTGVNDDWTINIMDFNYKWDQKRREKQNVNPSEIINMWWRISKPIIREDTVPEAQDLSAEAMWLTIWLWGTEWERKQIMKNIVDKATKDWITLQEAKKALKYRTPSDIDFSKNMNEQYDWIRKASWAMTQVKSAITALKNPNATTDLVGIVWLLKSIDPWSVARSDEVSNVENARSVLDTFSVQWEKLKSWKKLSQEQRAQLINAMQTQVDSYQNRETEFAKEVINEYETRWMNPSDLFTKSIIDRAKWTAPASTQGSTNDDPLWILQ